MGIAALADAEVIEAISISKDQQDKIKSINTEYAAKRAELNTGGGDRTEALAKMQEQNKELEDLVEELREKVEALRQPGVDEREALAKLSEMETAIKAQQAQYNVAAVDAQLQSLGNAMQVAESMQSAGKALAESKFDKAAEEVFADRAPAPRPVLRWLRILSFGGRVGSPHIRLQDMRPLQLTP